jgi:hypothetical protein
MVPIITDDPFGLTESAILKNATGKNQTTPGVYFLIKDNRIVYVGQTVNIHNRLSGHGDKDFDAVALVEVTDKSIRNNVEAHYSVTLAPPYNKIVPTKHYIGEKQKKIAAKEPVLPQSAIQQIWITMAIAAAILLYVVMSASG